MAAGVQPPALQTWHLRVCDQLQDILDSAHASSVSDDNTFTDICLSWRVTNGATTHGHLSNSPLQAAVHGRWCLALKPYMCSLATLIPTSTLGLAAAQARVESWWQALASAAHSSHAEPPARDYQPSTHVHARERNNEKFCNTSQSCYTCCTPLQRIGTTRRACVTLTQMARPQKFRPRTCQGPGTAAATRRRPWGRQRASLCGPASRDRTG